jgi:two-component sensor histidine kinase
VAASLFRVPISIVSLVDTDRIWFKSHSGVDATEIPRSPGLCASAILGDGPLILPDARIDPTAMINPLVAGEFGLRFYMGVPLRTHDNFNLGTLCVIDREPRQVTEAEIAQLADLAAVVMDEMELRLSARRAISKLERSVQEKEVLLREVHHRVKNNLQVIGGLVALEARTAELAARGQFQDVLRRIESIGRLHERFYRGDDIGAIELLDFLAGLAGQVVESYGLSHRIAVEHAGEEVRIGLDAGTPLALIVAELAANACKHAFPGERSGRIRIAGERSGGDYMLRVEDDGVGIGIDCQPKPDSMGLRLTRMMVSQLDGSYETGKPARGSAFAIRFPLR